MRKLVSSRPARLRTPEILKAFRVKAVNLWEWTLIANQHPDCLLHENNMCENSIPANQQLSGAASDNLSSSAIWQGNRFFLNWK
jgi:hypothetical protein